MQSSGRKVILFIAMSLDGFIAGPENDLSFLEIVAAANEDYGYTDFLSGIDTVIIGRKTFEWVLKHASWPHADRDTFVISGNRATLPVMDRVQGFDHSLEELIKDLKSKPGKDIYCDGGAVLVNSLIEMGLLDECIISVIPVILGGGTRLFSNSNPLTKLHHLDTRTYSSGLVQLHYGIQL